MHTKTVRINLSYVFLRCNMEKKLFVVDIVSSFRLRYVVEAKEESHALDEVVCRCR